MFPFKNKLLFLLLIVLLGLIALIFTPPIAQDIEYHHFCDSRTILSIPNFYNVISNLPFLIFGVFGIILCLYFRERKESDLMLTANLCFFIGIFFTGLGSAFYHLQPNNASLVWDRIPMTIAFMAFFSILISEYIHVGLGKTLLFHLIALGILSVIYWYKTEQTGYGDLRFYVLVQFMPMILTPIILLLFRNEGRFSIFYWCIAGVYLLAKILELNDQAIFSFTQSLGGHSLKHVFASLVALIYLLKVWYEKILNRA
jgi:hypothetical protein